MAVLDASAIVVAVVVLFAPIAHVSDVDPGVPKLGVADAFPDDPHPPPWPPPPLAAVVPPVEFAPFPPGPTACIDQFAVLKSLGTSHVTVPCER